MKVLNLIIIAVVLIISASAISYYLIDSYYTLDTQHIPMNLEVSDYVGMNLDTDALNLGTVNYGGSSARNITVTNHYDFPVSVRIEVLGDLTKGTIISENDFVLGAGASRYITFSVSSVGLMKGNYSSMVEIQLTRT